MAKFTIVLLGPRSSPHIEAFREPAEVLVAALQSLGQEVVGPVREEPRALGSSARRQLIVFGAMYAAGPTSRELPAGAIIYNLEQARSGWFTSSVVALYKRHAVWDYNADNAARLGAMYGISVAAVVPLGDQDGVLKRFDCLPDTERDLDVVLTGAACSRRTALFDAMRARGLYCTLWTGGYGRERDEILARCRLVLNCHFYGSAAPFESARVSYAVANGLPVLSEVSEGTDSWALGGAVRFAEYADLARVAEELIHAPTTRKNMADVALVELRNSPVAPYVAAALEKLVYHAALIGGSFGSEPEPVPEEFARSVYHLADYKPVSQNTCIALAMVVGDELPAVLERAIVSALPHVQSWLVSFNGQGIEVPALVERLLGHLPGVCVRLPWVNYGTSRTELIRAAETLLQAENLLLLDSDEVFEGVVGVLTDLSMDGYYVEEQTGTEICNKIRVIRTNCGWRYVGAAHEYLTLSNTLASVGRLPVLVKNMRDGASSRVPRVGRFLREAAMFQRELAVNPDDVRAQFYLAQSLEMAGRYKDAVKAYGCRVEMGGFEEECWAAMLRIARIFAHQDTEGMVSLVPGAFLAAHQRRPSRVEAIFYLAEWYRNRDMHHLALMFSREATLIQRPVDDLLFIEQDLYDWRVQDEYALACINTGHWHRAINEYSDLLEGDGSKLPLSQRERVQKNLAVAKRRLSEV